MRGLRTSAQTPGRHSQAAADPTRPLQLLGGQQAPSPFHKVRWHPSQTVSRCGLLTTPQPGSLQPQPGPPLLVPNLVGHRHQHHQSVHLQHPGRIARPPVWHRALLALGPNRTTRRRPPLQPPMATPLSRPQHRPPVTARRWAGRFQVCLPPSAARSAALDLRHLPSEMLCREY
ncbi:hypothetical protein NDU88_002855 [Pleurodeles waltl]|uniref:Uncharacterized protein n=1 Tax=Pleurodeles waltl TaxID=8319 RepID=A0AAV7T3Q9_PLEWA|nr:hypothetical protein NDU88_002855 [Pleurodeles waltl]